MFNGHNRKNFSFSSQLIGGSADLMDQIIQKQTIQKLLIKTLTVTIFITVSENMVWQR